MTEFTLQRGDEVDSEGITGVQGTLTEPNAKFSCLTLENLAFLCLAGRYQLKPEPMVSHKNILRAELQDVKGHTGVFLHSGEKAADSKMCPLVGRIRPTPGTLAGGLSALVADKIARMVQADPNNSWLVIKDKPT